MRKALGLRNFTAIFVVVCLVGVLVCTDLLRVKPAAASLSLPSPTELLAPAAAFSLPVLKGLRFDKDAASALAFIVDSCDERSVERDEVQRLINYFLAGLTTPDQDLWVNLSPYESDRVLAEGMETTELGRDLLAQDYLLKQLASSLTHPDTPTGEAYWRVENGKSTIENRLGKIWIVPDTAEVYESGTTVVITEASLKLQCEDAAQQVLLPAIVKDVNEGRNFAKLRQIYHSLILAKWFKTKLKDSLYAAYIDQYKLKGIDTCDPDLKEKIFGLYIESFKKGVYDTIRSDSASDQFSILDSRFSKNRRRRFFSGGAMFGDIGISGSAITDFSAVPIDGRLYYVSGQTVQVSDTSSSIETLQVQVMTEQMINALDPLQILSPAEMYALLRAPDSPAKLKFLGEYEKRHADGYSASMMSPEELALHREELKRKNRMSNVAKLAAQVSTHIETLSQLRTVAEVNGYDLPLALKQAIYTLLLPEDARRLRGMFVAARKRRIQELKASSALREDRIDPVEQIKVAGLDKRTVAGVIRNVIDTFVDPLSGDGKKIRSALSRLSITYSLEERLECVPGINPFMKSYTIEVPFSSENIRADLAYALGQFVAYVLMLDEYANTMGYALMTLVQGRAYDPSIPAELPLDAVKAAMKAPTMSAVRAAYQRYLQERNELLEKKKALKKERRYLELLAVSWDILSARAKYEEYVDLLDYSSINGVDAPGASEGHRAQYAGEYMAAQAFAKYPDEPAKAFALIVSVTREILQETVALGRLKDKRTAASSSSLNIDYAIRRSVTFAVSLMLLVLVSPFMLSVAGWIKAVALANPRWRGPVLLKQRRIGRNNQPFTLYKFRTMEYFDDDAFRIKGVIPGGKFLRRFMDETPQLFNFLKGEMDLIGPRPVRETEHEVLRDVFPQWNERLNGVYPGLGNESSLLLNASGFKKQFKSPGELIEFYKSDFGRMMLEKDIDSARSRTFMTDLRIATGFVVYALGFKYDTVRRIASERAEDSLPAVSSSIVNGGIELGSIAVGGSAGATTAVSASALAAVDGYTYRIFKISRLDSLHELSMVDVP